MATSASDERASPKLALALSGGGFRAAAFHFGVLLRLAVEGRLENVDTVSTVSGGSIAVGLIMQGHHPEWPSSVTYLERVYPRLRNLLTTTDLFSGKAIGIGGLFRYNGRLLNDRAGVLGDILERRFSIASSLRDLPERPTWWINATNYETGKNWRFSRREMGDWVFGRHYNPNIPVSQAIAASAAVPYVIGALHVTLPSDGWYKTDPATKTPLHRVDPPTTEVRLWDGGVYENMGLEAIYKPGRAERPYDLILASDASGAIGAPTGNPIRSLLSGKLAAPRLFDIGADQIRSLRSRMFMRDVSAGTIRGALLRMGRSTREIHIGGNLLDPKNNYDAYLSDERVGIAFRYPVNLAALDRDTFDLVARHGFEVADATLFTHVAADKSHYLWPF